MYKFKVSVCRHTDGYVFVEADCSDEAEEKAKQVPVNEWHGQDYEITSNVFIVEPK